MYNQHSVDLALHNLNIHNTRYKHRNSLHVMQLEIIKEYINVVQSCPIVLEVQ